jgi:hypothetical protein
MGYGRVTSRVRRIRTFFDALRNASKQKWILFASYSNVLIYSQTPFIRIILIKFASKYSHKFAYNIRFDAKQQKLKQLFASEQILASHILLLANIRVLANICILWIIRLQIFAY